MCAQRQTFNLRLVACACLPVGSCNSVCGHNLACFSVTQDYICCSLHDHFLTKLFCGEEHKYVCQCKLPARGRSHVTFSYCKMCYDWWLLEVIYFEVIWHSKVCWPWGLLACKITKDHAYVDKEFYRFEMLR